MSIVLRIDDFPFVKKEESWLHNLEGFKKFDAVLEKHGVPEYVLGVIPSRTTRDQIKWLAENPRVHVALHGIYHDEKRLNEFAPFETEKDIASKVLSACTFLRECNGNGKIDSYIPPHNCVDLKTARVLSKLGFKRLFCGPGTDLSVYEMIEKSKLFPEKGLTYSSHPHFYGRSDELLDRDDIVAQLKAQVNLPDPLVVTLHFTWEMNIGLQSLDRLMSQIGSMIGEIE